MADRDSLSPKLSPQPLAQYLELFPTVVATGNAGLIRHDNDFIAEPSGFATELKNARDEIEVTDFVYVSMVDVDNTITVKECYFH